MDFHAAMETFAEAWVAANTQTAVNSGQQPQRSMPLDDLPTMLSKEQLSETQTTKMKKSSTKPSALPPDALLPPLAAGKSVPVHCIVEQSVKSPPDGSSSVASTHTSVDMDSYAILPGNTLFSELVRAALLKLGYSCTEAVGAKGAVTIKNWKPLTFDTVTDNPDATVDEVLGELTSVATLRIRLCRTVEEVIEWTDDRVKSSVIELLKEVNQTTLAKMCPLSQSMISNIANSKYTAKICPDKCQEFGDWLKKYRQEVREKETFPDGLPKDARMTFHPLYELSNMREWFKNCKNPTRQKLQQFAEQLNKGHIRHQRQKVTPSRLRIWWKNEKQRERKLISKNECEDTFRAGAEPNEKNTTKRTLFQDSDSSNVSCIRSEEGLNPNQTRMIQSRASHQDMSRDHRDIMSRVPRQQIHNVDHVPLTIPLVSGNRDSMIVPDRVNQMSMSAMHHRTAPSSGVPLSVSPLPSGQKNPHADHIPLPMSLQDQSDMQFF